MVKVPRRNDETNEVRVMTGYECLNVKERPVCAIAAARARDGPSRRPRVTALPAWYWTAAGSERASWTFDPKVSSVPRARHQAGEVVRGWGLTDASATTELLVTEVIANAIDQTQEPVRLSLAVTEGQLRGEVEDHDPKHTLPEQASLPDTDAESGRGLFLLDTLASRWGVEYTTTGKIVWFELACG
ncbi:ATP-binding protein [Nonomuraea sp. KM90]|uniref:ATP-binding protein n=1 Tax=Nonomuraea sp. KM90 TaxID=3457428 RepID=UPI003FCC504B